MFKRQNHTLEKVADWGSPALFSGWQWGGQPAPCPGLPWDNVCWGFQCRVAWHRSGLFSDWVRNEKIHWALEQMTSCTCSVEGKLILRGPQFQWETVQAAAGWEFFPGVRD